MVAVYLNSVKGVGGYLIKSTGLDRIYMSLQDFDRPAGGKVNVIPASRRLELDGSLGSSTGTAGTAVSHSRPLGFNAEDAEAQRIAEISAMESSMRDGSPYSCL